MTDEEFSNLLGEKLAKLGGKRTLGFHYLHPFGRVPEDSIVCNGATYSRVLYKDFYDYAVKSGWVKSETEWQNIASANGGYCPWYSTGDNSTTFRTPKFAPYIKTAPNTSNAGEYTMAGLPNIQGSTRFDYGALTTSVGTGCIDTGPSENARYLTIEGSSHKTKMSININASLSNPIYGKSSTVQPESSSWMVCVVVLGIVTNIGSVDVGNILQTVNQIQNEKINISGSRGQLAGHESASVVSGNQTISGSTPDTMLIKTNGATTITFTPMAEGENAVKEIAFHADATTTLTFNSAVWSNKGNPPKWGTAGKNLVIVANFIGGRVVLSVNDNDE